MHENYYNYLISFNKINFKGLHFRFTKSKKTKIEHLKVQGLKFNKFQSTGTQMVLLPTNNDNDNDNNRYILVETFSSSIRLSFKHFPVA